MYASKLRTYMYPSRPEALGRLRRPVGHMNVIHELSKSCRDSSRNCHGTRETLKFDDKYMQNKYKYLPYVRLLSRYQYRVGSQTSAVSSDTDLFCCLPWLADGMTPDCVSIPLEDPKGVGPQYIDVPNQRLPRAKQGPPGGVAGC